MQLTNAPFDAVSELQQIRMRREESRRKRFAKSKCDRYRAELVAMRQAGASAADLVEWLRLRHRIKINRSNVDRFLKSLPELKGFTPVRKAKKDSSNDQG